MSAYQLGVLDRRDEARLWAALQEAHALMSLLELKVPGVWDACGASGQLAPGIMDAARRALAEVPDPATAGRLSLVRAEVECKIHGHVIMGYQPMRASLEPVGGRPLVCPVCAYNADLQAAQKKTS